MRKWIRLVANLFWLFEILFFIRELFKEGKGVLEVLMPAVSASEDSFYFAFIGTGIAALCYVNYDLWANWRERAHENRPDTKFRNMYYDLQIESDLSLQDVEDPFICRSQTAKFQAREALRHELSKLDIPAPIPTMAVSDERWHKFISIMSVFAKDGRLGEAMRLYNELDR